MGGVWEIMERMQGRIAAEIRVMLGEGPYDEKIFTPEERARRVEALKGAAGGSSDSVRHDSWMKMHVDAGWVYGPEFDPSNKRHPNLLPWDQLPSSTRSKARIFAFVADAAKEIEGEVSEDTAR